MKLLLILLATLLSLFSYSKSSEIPNILSDIAKAYVDQPNSYPTYRVDLIIIKNATVLDEDKSEIWPQLQEWNLSNNLVKVSSVPTLLVDDRSISKGLETNEMIVKTIEYKNKGSLENEIKDETHETNQNHKLHVEFFESIDEHTIKDITKKIQLSDEYKLLYHNSWYQPLFNKNLSFPVFIQSKDKVSDYIYGELLIYKERFLHSQMRIRFSDISEGKPMNLEHIKTHNFNELINKIKVDKNKRQRKYFWADALVNKINIQFKNFSNLFTESYNNPMSMIKENKIDNVKKSSSSVFIFKDKFEINESRKMLDGELHYIDHPYFGVLITLTPWREPET